MTVPDTAPAAAAPVPAQISPSSTPAKRAGKSRRTESKPSLAQVLELRSYQAQHVHKRAFNKVLNSLFLSDVILRVISKSSPDGEDDAEKLNAVVAEELLKVENELKAETGRVSKLIEQHAITAFATYDKTLTVSVAITSPLGARFSTLLRSMDTLVGLIDTLWLHEHFTGKQRNAAVRQWSRRVLKIANRIIEMEKRARRKAQRAGKEAEVAAVAPVETTEVDESDAHTPADDIEEAGEVETFTVPAEAGSDAAVPEPAAAELKEKKARSRRTAASVPDSAAA